MKLIILLTVIVWLLVILQEPVGLRNESTARMANRSISP